MKATRYSDEGEPLWDVGLSLEAYGDQAMPATIAREKLTEAKTDIDYHWNERVTEWYHNTPAGIKHGLTLH